MEEPLPTLVILTVVVESIDFLYQSMNYTKDFQ